MASAVSRLSNPFLLPEQKKSNGHLFSTRMTTPTAAVTSCAVAVKTQRPAVATTSAVVAIKLAATAPPAKAERRPTTLARMWREIQGCDDWEGLIEPLNPILRDEIVRYGEFVSACYEAFDLDSSSKRYLNCKFGKTSVLEEVGLESSGYAVTRYIYATPPQQDAGCSRWIGYVAAASDKEAERIGRRDILVSFRGTVTQAEWAANFMSSLTPARLDPHDPRPDVKVESGFLGIYTSEDSSCSKFSHGSSCRQQLLSEISKLLNKYKGEELSITLAGHSMGSSLALLLAYDIAELGLNSKYHHHMHNNGDERIPITVYSFAGPRVGNMAFKERCEELGVKVLRIVNVKDPVTKMPGVLLNDKLRSLAEKYGLAPPWSSCACYAHVGVELALDFFKMDNPIGVHDLDAHIGLLKCPKIVEKKVVKKEADNSTMAKKHLKSWQDQASSHVTDLLQGIYRNMQFSHDTVR